MAYWKCLGILEMMKISWTEFNYGEKCYWESFQYKVRQFVGCLWRIEWGILIIDIENFTHGANSIFSFTINPPKTGCMPFFYRFIKSNRKINDNRTTNPYLRHFGNVMERHLWTKNPQSHFGSDDVIHRSKFFTLC